MYKDIHFLIKERKTSKKIMKKLLMSLLAVLMVCALLSPISAEETGYTNISDPGIVEAIENEVPDPILADAILKALDEKMGENPGVEWREVMGKIETISVPYDENTMDHKIQDITGINLALLTGLKNVDLSGHAIQDITPLSTCSKVVFLNLGNNLIQDIAPLSKMTKLEVVNLSGNLIEETGPLQYLPYLKDLDVSNNKIEDLGSLNVMNGGIERTALKTLIASGNLIEDIGFLENITNLETLYLADNKIEDLRALDGKTTITNLDLSGNEIEDISPLYTLANLTFLNLSNNHIMDQSQLENLPAGLELNVEGQTEKPTEPVVKPEEPSKEETKPSTPSISCAGEKDKNCDGVITCDEEKGEGWTWNNAKGVCEYTGTTSSTYTVVNTAVK